MNGIRNFQQFVNEAWGRGSRSNKHRAEIRIDELNFVVDEVIYVTYETVCDVEYMVEPPDPSVGIFGESVEITDVKITDVLGAVKFEEEQNSGLIGFLKVSRSLGLSGRDMEKVLYEHVDKYLTDAQEISDEEKANLISRLNELESTGKIKLFDGTNFDTLVQRKVENVDQSGDDDYEEPDLDD